MPQGHECGSPISKGGPPFQSLASPSTLVLDFSLQVQAIFVHQYSLATLVQAGCTRDSFGFTILKLYDHPTPPHLLILFGQAEDEEWEGPAVEEDSDENEVEASLEYCPEVRDPPNIELSNQPLLSPDEPNFLNIMDQMTQFMGKLTQEVSSRDTSRAPAFKAPDSFHGT
ncbi:hypothetical protein O181_020765 [Austropuccinia psidii MF-1]|uniref:Uncharacterized protein n=1 Tax=Austropuccinia psidii MF-1 TaxID=1389203 RepID=A0A9Q3CED9_9BASI|nr:hypothetical protein [Austropuccinia psidii MF-1]